MKMVERYLKKFPFNVNGKLLMGMIQEEKGDTDAAESTYRDVLDYGPNNIRAVNRLAKLEEKKSAPSDYWKKSLLRLDPLSPIVADMIPAFEIEEEVEEASEEADTGADIEQEQIPPEVETNSADEGVIADEGVTVDEAAVEDSDFYQGEGAPDEAEVPAAEETMLEEEDTTAEDESDIQVEEPPPEEISEPEREYPERQIAEKEAAPGPEVEQVDTLELPDDGEGVDLFPADEAEDEPIEPPPSGEGYAPTEAEINELERVYREIEEHHSEKEPSTASLHAKGVNTVTLAELFATQGNYEKALEIYNTLPEEEKAPHEYRMRELEKKLKERQGD